MWVARYLFKVKSPSGAGAVRGIASEFVLANKYKEGTFDYDLLNMKFMTLCTESMIDLGDKKTEKERGMLKGFGEVIDKNFDYDNLEDYQEKVEVQLEDLPVPIMGYIDFRFKDKIVDLKYINEEDKIILKKELINNKFKFIKNTTYESIKEKKI